MGPGERRAGGEGVDPGLPGAGGGEGTGGAVGVAGPREPLGPQEGALVAPPGERRVAVGGRLGEGRALVPVGLDVLGRGGGPRVGCGGGIEPGQGEVEGVVPQEHGGLHRAAPVPRRPPRGVGQDVTVKALHRDLPPARRLAREALGHRPGEDRALPALRRPAHLPRRAGREDHEVTVATEQGGELGEEAVAEDAQLAVAPDEAGGEDQELRRPFLLLERPEEVGRGGQRPLRAERAVGGRDEGARPLPVARRRDPDRGQVDDDRVAAAAREHLGERLPPFLRLDRRPRLRGEPPPVVGHRRRRARQGLGGPRASRPGASGRAGGGPNERPTG